MVAEDFNKTYTNVTRTWAPRSFGPAACAARVEFGAVSHTGYVRELNEDHYAVVRRSRSRTVLSTNMPEYAIPDVDEYAYAMAVADGVGGRVFGEIASFLAIQMAGELGLSEIEWPDELTDSHAHHAIATIKRYGEVIHEAMMDFSRRQPHCAGMATTLTLAYTVGRDAFIGHVGDSRAYLMRGNTLRQITCDHTVLMPVGETDADGVPLDPEPQFRYMLTNVLGAGRDSVAIETNYLRLADYDRLVLCTDGLTNMVSDAEIQEILNVTPDPQTAAQALLDRALKYGGRDNITIVVSRYRI